MKTNTGQTLRRYLLAAGASSFSVGVLTAGITLLLRPLFLSSVTFMPDKPSSSPFEATGLGAVFGQLALGGLTEGTQSLAFYRHLAESEDVLSRVVNKSIPDSIAAPAPNLAIMWHEDEEELDKRTAMATKRLSRYLSVEVDQLTGIVTLGVLARSQDLARWLTTSIFEELNRYNVEVRRSRAQARRQFLETRVQHSQDSLEHLEALLTSFYQQNLLYQQNPGLVSQERQLSRRVDGHFQILTSLQRELESARLDEIRDTPVLSIIQAPSRPAFRARPTRTRTTLQFALLAAIIGIAFEVGWPWSEALFARLRRR